MKRLDETRRDGRAFADWLRKELLAIGDATERTKRLSRRELGAYVLKETGRREMCECHVARPTRYGFPTVRMDDFCALHVDSKTLERTFAGLAAPVAMTSEG